MFCPNCGKELPEGAKFCDECGTRLSDMQPDQYEPPYQDAIQEIEEQNPYAAKPPARKISIVKIIAVCAVIALLIGVARASIGMLLKTREETGSQNSGPASVTIRPAGNAGKSGSAGNSGNAGTAGTNGTAGNNVPAGNAGTAGESVPEWDEKWLLGENEGTAASAADFSTDALPGEEDFLWFYDHAANLVNAAIPEGAEVITDPVRLAGGWKCMVVRKPNTAPTREYWNIDLDMSESGVLCTQRWSGKVEPGGAFEDLSAANSNPLEGGFYHGCIMDLRDDYGSTLSIVQWYEYNGKQYGIGTYECGWDEEDSMGLAAVCRP